MLSKFLDKIKYSFVNEPKIEIINNNQVNVIGCRGITALSDEIIGAKMPKFSVMVYGQDLKLTEYRFDMVEISGKITSIEMA